MDATVLVLWLGCGVFAAVIADHKGHSMGGWFLAGLVFGVFALIAAFIVDPKPVGKLGQLTAAGEAGWHRDPTGRFDRRYYDGRAWTLHVTRDADKQQFEDPL